MSSEGLPLLSVVLAVQGGETRLPEVLAAFGPARGDVELLAVHPAEERGVSEVCAANGWGEPIPAERGALVPELWRLGILRARAPRVALTVVHCRTSPEWVARALSADLSEHAALGGTIDNDPDSDGLGWAIFALRYLRHAPPLEPVETTDLAGDNAVYDREALLSVRESWEHGFWEPEVHARLAASGRRLRLEPSLGATHANGYRAPEIARQRLAHGRQYGRDRALAMAAGRRLLYALATPLVPPVLGAKVLRRALGHVGLRRNLLRALPALSLLLLAWGFGELRGAWAAVLRR